MRITTGLELALSLRQGDYVQIDRDDAKVHHAYADKETGESRICRKLHEKRPKRSWRGSADGLPGEPCEACNR